MKLKTPSDIRRKRTAGFSLIEIVLVFALIGILAVVLVQNVDNIFGAGQEDGANMWVTATVKVPLTMYKKDIGTYPTSEEGLRALVTAPAGKAGRWRGPYMETLPNDPWNTPYNYKSPGTNNPRGYDVWSSGPDLQSGTADDIGNWQTGGTQ
ncbi:MAG: type II secretion system major pseudopilin GspG [Opitutales bacterium]